LLIILKIYTKNLNFQGFFYISFIKRIDYYYKMTLVEELQGYQVGSTPRLGEEFFARHSAVVAMDLLGRYIVRKFENDTYVVGQIREVGAYQGETDGSSAQMKNSAGVYSVNNRYGNNLFDVATETEGFASCVQLRGAAFDFGGLINLREIIALEQEESSELALLEEIVEVLGDE
jgi:hypothetical protein